MNKNVMVFSITLLLFVSLFTISTHAYPIEDVTTGNPTENLSAVGQDNITPQYSTVPIPIQFKIDAPWRIENSETNIPVVAIINLVGLDVDNIAILDANNGDAEVANTNWPSTQTITNVPYFYEFSIPKGNLTPIGGTVSLKVKFYLPFVSDEIRGPVDIEVSSSDLPKPSNWFAGDTHYHTNYSDNPAEFAAPIAESRSAAEAIGLDWITISDHSFAFTASDWPNLVSESDSNSDGSFRFIAGEEVSTNDDPEPYRHFLAHGINTYIEGDEILANFELTQLTPAELVDEVNNQGGVGYVAHPFYFDGLRKPWEEDDFSLPFTGLQIWNYGTGGNDFSEGSEISKGLNKWQELLLSGRQIYISGGSDAHGDFSHMETVLGETGNAYGKVRTYIYCPGTFSKNCVLDALRYGHSAMTNGPFLALWSRPSSEPFNQENHLMGNQVNHPSQKQATFHVYYDTTNFGEGQLKVYKGKIHNSNETLVGTPQTVSTSGDAYFYDSPGAARRNLFIIYILLYSVEVGKIETD